METLAPLANDPIMLGRSIWLFGHPEYQNLSIIDAMGNCIRIRKNVTDREQTENGEQRTDRETKLESDDNHSKTNESSVFQIFNENR